MASPVPNTPSQIHLPDPDESPDSAVVIFDGNCRFCQKQVATLVRFDGKARLSFISLHDPRVAERFPDLTHDQMMQQMYVISNDGTAYGGAVALRYLSRHLPRLWWAVPFLHIPFSLPIWKWLYRQVAIRRYKISERLAKSECPEGTCSVHYEKHHK